MRFKSDRDTGLKAMRAKYAEYLPKEAFEVVSKAADVELPEQDTDDAASTGDKSPEDAADIELPEEDVDAASDAS